MLKVFQVAVLLAHALFGIATCRHNALLQHANELRINEYKSDLNHLAQIRLNVKSIHDTVPFSIGGNDMHDADCGNDNDETLHNVQTTTNTDKRSEEKMIGKKFKKKTKTKRAANRRAPRTRKGQRREGMSTGYKHYFINPPPYLVYNRKTGSYDPYYHYSRGSRRW